jgi:glycosyltransferase involved in cell wall biosynthesis
MIVKNEENNLARCLESVKNIVDEMIVVDTGSEDGTVEIARQFGARVFFFEWNGSFSDARNFSLKQANGDWILIMDADDEMHPYKPEEIRKLITDTDADAYFFETISYIGDAPGGEVVKNMNIRLIKNHQGYFFSNPIHEQIFGTIMALNPEAKIVNQNMIVYHYGYLNQNIAGGNKRQRNIALLQRELEESPECGFTLFNLGSEYCALNDAETALVYFEKAYENFKPDEGYSSHLILKMVCCYIELHRFEEALTFCAKGLNHYPGFTDLEYLKGLAYDTWGKKALALKSFQQCCQWGEAPVYLNVIIGTGTYRPCLMAGNIYYEWELFDEAAKSLENAYEKNCRCEETITMLVRTYCALKLTDEILMQRIAALNTFKEYGIAVAETLIDQKKFGVAIEFIGRHEKQFGDIRFARYYAGYCRLCQGDYTEACTCFAKLAEDAEYGIRAICMHAVCLMSLRQYAQAKALLEKHVQKDEMTEVCILLNALLKGEEAHMLCSEKQYSVAYTDSIFEVLKVLLITKQLQEFEKALELLGCINDTTVLLRLGKLYFNENCFGLAYRELTRSIKLFDVLDVEGAKMVLCLKNKGL